VLSRLAARGARRRWGDFFPRGLGYASTTMVQSTRERGFPARLIRWAVLAGVAMAGLGACSVSDTGLGPGPDGSSATVGPCPAGLTEQASWPARSTASTCMRPCGPDRIGLQACTQADRASCQAKPGCLCLEAPCVTCAACVVAAGDCYQPTNSATVPPCATGAGEGRPCSPVCGRQVCLRADGKTACICNGQGRYACADWTGTAWQ
jgi:hypothetical protein